MTRGRPFRGPSDRMRVSSCVDSYLLRHLGSQEESRSERQFYDSLYRTSGVNNGGVQLNPGRGVPGMGFLLNHGLQ